MHLYRAYEVSEGRFVPRALDGKSGDFLPRSVPRLAAGLIGNVPFHAERRFYL